MKDSEAGSAYDTKFFYDKEVIVCDWCPDDTCESYWVLTVFKHKHRICNCCYEHLKKEEGKGY